MVQDFREIDFTDFYDFYKKIDDPKIKRLLQSHMAKKCRVDSNTIKQWISRRSIPFYQSNRVTEAVSLISVHLNLNSYTLTEKVLFPNYSLLIESYAE